MTKEKPFMTSLAMDLELRRKIDEVRLARARENQSVPPPMRAIVVEALTEYLDRHEPSAQ